MTTFIPINANEVAVDKPVTNELLTKINNNTLALQEQDSSLWGTENYPLKLKDHTHYPNYTAGEKIRIFCGVGQNYYSKNSTGVSEPPVDNTAVADYFDGVKIRANGTFRVRLVMWHKKTSGSNLTTTVRFYKSDIGGNYTEETISGNAFLSNTTNSTSFNVTTAVKDIAFVRNEGFKININRSTNTEMVCYVIISTAESGTEFRTMKDANAMHSNNDPNNTASSPFLNPDRKLHYDTPVTNNKQITHPDGASESQGYAIDGQNNGGR
jgi:hypothetical protein